MLLILAQLSYWIVVLLHVLFAVLEMVLWKSKGPKIFGMSREFASQSARLASNQGLYNLFIVAALLIGFFAGNADVALMMKFYGLGCVIAAGLWGAVTVGRTIFFVQALPGIIALALQIILSGQG